MTGLLPADEARLLEDALRTLLTDRCTPRDVRAAEGGWSAGLWAALAAMGVPGLGVPEARGGSGGGVEEAALAVRLAAGYAAPVPVAETALLAGRLLAEAGLDLPEGAPVGFGFGRLARTAAGVSGILADVPWAREAGHLVAVAGDEVVLLATGDSAVVRGTNVAGEPRDRVDLEAVAPLRVAAAPGSVTEPGLRARAAAVRAIQISGAADRVLELCVEHARLREQFGRPIASFQAVAHLLARAAGAAVAAQGAARLAVRALAADDPALAGSAKVVAGEAAGTIAALAHQVHGAIGMTREHPLQLFTRRLWAWRDEHGGERYWARRCGARLVGTGNEAWHDLVEV